MVADRVKGRVVGIPERDLVSVPERVNDNDRVRVTETVPDFVAKLEA
jgi:hypothetical protein